VEYERAVELSYGESNEQANRLAPLDEGIGSEADEGWGFCVERGLG